MNTKRNSFFSGYNHLRDSFRKYYRAYGGWTQILKSPYFHGAILLTGFMHAFWIQPDWWDLVLSIIPSIFGFTLAAFGMVLAIGSGVFGSMLAKARLYDEEPENSDMAKVAAAFVHFLGLQFGALLLALFFKGCYLLPAPFFAPILAEPITRNVGWGLGFLVAMYALTSSISVCDWIFTLVMKLIEYHKAARRFRSKAEQ